MSPEPKKNKYGPTSFTCGFNALDVRSVKETYELLRTYAGLLEVSLATLRPVGHDTGPKNRRNFTANSRTTLYAGNVDEWKLAPVAEYTPFTEKTFPYKQARAGAVQHVGTGRRSFVTAWGPDGVTLSDIGLVSWAVLAENYTWVEKPQHKCAKLVNRTAVYKVSEFDTDVAPADDDLADEDDEDDDLDDEDEEDEEDDDN